MSMILYNIRYRGPFEYDKFILNTFQLYNETQRLTTNLYDKSLTELNNSKNELFDIFDELTKVDSILQNILYCKEKIE